MMSDGERRHHSNNEQQLQQFQQQYHHDRNDASCGPTPTSGFNITHHFYGKFCHFFSSSSNFCSKLECLLHIEKIR